MRTKELQQTLIKMRDIGLLGEKMISDRLQTKRALVFNYIFNSAFSLITVYMIVLLFSIIKLIPGDSNPYIALGAMMGVLSFSLIIVDKILAPTIGDLIINFLDLKDGEYR